MDIPKQAGSPPHQSLYEYYKNQYPIDLENFKLACPTHKIEGIEGKGYFVDDLDYFRDINYPLPNLKKEHFIYFMVIQTAFLMVIHKYFHDKYEEYKIKNKGVLFEFGLTNTFVYPWDILKRLKLGFNKSLFQNCLGYLIMEIFENDNLCGIIPRDFIRKLTTDPDLTNRENMIGRVWEKMCMDEYLAIKF